VCSYLRSMVSDKEPKSEVKPSPAGVDDGSNAERASGLQGLADSVGLGPVLQQASAALGMGPSPEEIDAQVRAQHEALMVQNEQIMAQARSRFHVVGPGETLSTITQDRGRPVEDWEVLHEHNRDVVPDPRRLEPGTQLRIPHDWGSSDGSGETAPEQEATADALVLEEQSAEQDEPGLMDQISSVGSDGLSALGHLGGALMDGLGWDEGGDQGQASEQGSATTLETAPQSSPVLDAGEKYIDQIDRYGFGDEALLKNGGLERGEMDEMWCSGLVTATFIDMGIDVDAPIEGETYRENGRDKDLTLRHVVEGMTEPLAETDEHAAAIAAVPRGNDSYADFLGRRSDAGYGHEGLFGDTPAEDSLRVKGAAGALVLAGLGEEVPSTHDARPGDLVQSRDVGGDQGHASIVHTVVADGAAVFGLPGSPELIGAKDEGEAVSGGTLYQEARFTITRQTDPATVRHGHALQWRVLESQEARGIPRDRRAEMPNGGVWVTDHRDVPDLADMEQEEKRWYVGRLSSSPWSTQQEDAVS
jgi:hypothetical protein